MAAHRDRSALRRLLGEQVPGLAWDSHARLNAALAELAMPPVPVEVGTKNARIEQSFGQVSDDELHKVAESMLAQGRLPAATRNQLEDLLWAESSPPEVPKKIRRELSRALNLDLLCRNEERFIRLLDRFWALGEENPLDVVFSTSRPRLLRDHIRQHVCRNQDWSVEDLFEQLGAFQAGDARFARFLEGLVSADVLLDDQAQHLLVAAINEHIRSTGLELRETGTDGGYPSFTAVSTRLADNRRPKNLIFASPTKPDIRFSSAVDNDIEIPTGDVLVYDRPITGDGLRWRELQAWWQDTQHITSETEAKKSLYQRLRNSLPDNSPGQRHLFDLYHQILGSAVYDLPALLPEVWLHWDPQTVRERGPQALLRSRMDFLLLLPQAQRLVLEVDGSQHYTRDRGQRPDSTKYAQMVAGDRDLKLRGYEVFRFGHDELKHRASAKLLLERFLPALLHRFKVGITPG